MVVKTLIGVFLSTLALLACAHFSPNILTSSVSLAELGTSLAVHQVVVHEMGRNVAMPVYVFLPPDTGYGPWGKASYKINGDRYCKDLCLRKGDPGFTIEAAKRAMYAAYAWAHSQYFADPERILLESVSVGGMTAVAMGAKFWLGGVIGYINFSGGA